MTEIKELNIDNIEEIEALFFEIFTSEPWNDDWNDSVQLHEYLTDLIAGRNSLTIGLFENGELIGLSMGYIMHWYIGTEYLILEFCIRADRQGKGFGTMFLKEAERYAKAKGMTHIFLQTERTAPAYGFYIKNGFTELPDHVSFFKNFD